jgi:hypothetical protein
LPRPSDTVVGTNFVDLLLNLRDVDLPCSIQWLLYVFLYAGDKRTTIMFFK